MKQEDKYVVIGGQYEPAYYGARPTLLGAKRLASKNKEYWDNWQGWHTPSISRIEDTKEIVTHGMITCPDNQTIRIPDGAPTYVWNGNGDRWMKCGMSGEG